MKILFPSYRYHATLPPCVVASQEESDALGPGWSNLITPPAPPTDPTPKAPDAGPDPLAVDLVTALPLAKPKGAKPKGKATEPTPDAAS